MTSQTRQCHQCAKWGLQIRRIVTSGMMSRELLTPDTSSELQRERENNVSCRRHKNDVTQQLSDDNCHENRTLCDVSSRRSLIIPLHRKNSQARKIIYTEHEIRRSSTVTAATAFVNTPTKHSSFTGYLLGFTGVVTVVHWLPAWLFTILSSSEKDEKKL